MKQKIKQKLKNEAPLEMLSRNKIPTNQSSFLVTVSTFN